MNKQFYAVPAAELIFMLLLSSCSLAGSQYDTATPLVVPVTDVTTGNISTEKITDSENFTTSETTEVNAGQTEEAQPQEPFDGKFKPGTWFSYNKDECRYYFFNNDKSGGTRLSAKSGVASAFLYEMDDDMENTHKPAVFHIDSTSNTTNAEVIISNPDQITIIWDDKSEEKLTYISDKSINDFLFYTDKELCSMGLNYYAKISGKEDKRNSADCMSNEDGSVSIRVYKSVNDNEQTVLAWYIVDRLSAAGQKSDDGLSGNGSLIDLK